MGTVSIDLIGKYNKQLIVDIKAGKTVSSDFSIAEQWQHAQGYNYDLSYGIAGINTKRLWPGTIVGTKYYCVSSDGQWDYKKRIVYVHDPKNSAFVVRFFRLIHTPMHKSGTFTNDYAECDEITGH